MYQCFKNLNPILKRNFSTKEFSTAFAECLKERTIVRLSGDDASAFLQGLITNDVRHLTEGALSMFTLFLNSKGRILYDSIIYKSENENTFLIECDADASSSLINHLKMYRVRRKLNIDCLKDELDIWTIVTENNFMNPSEVTDYKKIMQVINQSLPKLVSVTDPRLQCLGLRIISPKNVNFITEIEKKADLKIEEKNFYKILRYKLGIGEGMFELPPEKCFPMEANGDYLHGISFHKGCYIGQELTARTYHTGVIRKRLMPLTFDKEVKINENGIPIFSVPQSSKSVGKLQGIKQTNGVGLLRIKEALNADELIVLDTKCKVHKPFWWPNEAPKERNKISEG